MVENIFEHLKLQGTQMVDKRDVTQLQDTNRQRRYCTPSVLMLSCNCCTSTIIYLHSSQSATKVAVRDLRCTDGWVCGALFWIVQVRTKYRTQTSLQ
jgi:hypothetical protein